MNYKVLGKIAVVLLMSGVVSAQEGRGAQPMGSAPSSQTPAVLKKVAFEQRLNTQLPLDLPFKDERGHIIEAPQSGKPALVCVRCKAHRKMDDINLIMAVSSMSLENERVLYLSSQYDKQPMSIKTGDVELQLELPYCGLSAGLYSAKIVISHKDIETLDVLESFRFRVSSDGISEQNLFYQPRRWKVSNS